MSIHLLSEEVIARIAAGEVVERPSSVVKELIENSLDAESSTVTVEVADGGKRLIRISDDGSGILSNEIELAFTRHATSKLATSNDLTTIKTLGFRGEALASISAVSQITVTSRQIEENAGTQLQIDGGMVVQKQLVGAPAGTVIQVENLFFNTPARLKFLRKTTTEKRHITNVVTHYAMAYPHVRFMLRQDGREVFRSSGSGHLADVAVKVFGLENFRRMVEASNDQEDLEYPAYVYGFVSEPGLNRSDRTQIILFVNGRAVQDSKLSYAVTQAYHTLLMNGRYPYAVLMIDIPPEVVDVNVHPTKAEVRFENANAIFVAVQRTVRRAVVDLSQVQQSRRTQFSTFDSPSDEIRNSRQLDMDLWMEDTGQFTRQRISERNDDSYENEFVSADPTEIPTGAGRPKRPRTLPLLRVVGQVAATYIVAEGPAGMYLIDQHAAHERILYEQFMESYEQQGTISQQALETQTVNLPATEAQLIEEHQEVLRSVGFELENFGPNMYAIRSVPAMLADADPVAVVTGVLEDLAQDKKPGQETIEEKIVRHVCKRVSVKAGQILSVEEMQGLIRQLERAKSPHTCPHGRPTIIHMSNDQLAQQFGRMG